MLDFLAHPLAVLYLTALLGACVDAQSTQPPPGQPAKSGTPGQFEIITNSLVSAQQVSCIFFLHIHIKINALQIFLGTLKVLRL